MININEKKINKQTNKQNSIKPQNSILNVLYCYIRVRTLPTVPEFRRAIGDGRGRVRINTPTGLPRLYDTFNRISKITEHSQRKHLIRKISVCYLNKAYRTPRVARLDGPLCSPSPWTRAPFCGREMGITL